MPDESSVAALEDVIEAFEEAADKCAKRLLRTAEAKKLIEDAKRRLPDLLPADSDAFRIFERESAEHTDWWTVRPGGYVDPEDCKNIRWWLDLVRRVSDEYEPEFLRGHRVEKAQYFLSQSDQYRAKKIVYQVMKRAQSELGVIDNYLDDTIFPFIDSLNDTVSVKMLTQRSKPIFVTLYQALKSSRPNTEAKFSTAFHDRFLVIDDREIWQLGCSINGLGRTAAMFAKLSGATEAQQFLQLFRTEWASGSPV